MTSFQTHWTTCIFEIIFLYFVCVYNILSTKDYYIGCYQSHAITWNEAKYYCRNHLNTNLAIIKNAQQSQSCTNLAKSYNCSAMGPNTTNSIFIGLQGNNIDHYHQNNSLWSWSDGTSLGNYSNWIQTENQFINNWNSSNTTTAKHCVELGGKDNFKWRDVRCNTQQFCFACNRPG